MGRPSGTWIPACLGVRGRPQARRPAANFLTPSAMDPNTWTPEFKTFLVEAREGGFEGVMTADGLEVGSRRPAFGALDESFAT